MIMMRWLTLALGGVAAAATSSAPFLPVYRPGDLGYACYMNPSVIAANTTVWAFAEVRRINPPTIFFERSLTSVLVHAIAGALAIMQRFRLPPGPAP